MKIYKYIIAISIVFLIVFGIYASQTKLGSTIHSLPQPGVSTFLGLSDVPNSYTGAAGKCAQVNIGESALVFGSCGTGGSGLTNLNGLTGSTQYFATGTAGTNFNIVSSGTSHTFNIPIASSTTTGLLSSANFTTFSNKLATTTWGGIGGTLSNQGDLNTALSGKQTASSALTSVAGLSWSSGAPFVKMTAAGTFGLDTNTYLTSLSGAVLTSRNITINGTTQDLSADRTWNVGTVTSTAIATANGFAGTVATATTLPTITLSTSCNGVCKANGTAISTASNGTDYTLISAQSCSAGQHISAITAAGVSTCSADSGGGGGGITWNDITGTSVTAVVNNGYVSDNAGLVTITLPATSTVGSMIYIQGGAAGGWKVAQSSGQQIVFGSLSSTVGATGYLASTQRYNAITLVNIVATTTWAVFSSIGNITLN